METQKPWHEFSKEEATQASAQVTEYVLKWMDSVGISFGSGAEYNLYSAVQEAVFNEWKKNN